MKKVILMVFIMLSSTLTMCSQQNIKDSNWNSLKLSGNVKNIIELSHPDTYENEKGEIIRGFRKEIYYYLLDENRDINKLMDSLTIECTDAFIFSYNKEGNLLKTKRFKARGSYVRQSDSTYEYDSEGKLISVKGSDEDFMTMYGSKSVSFLKLYEYGSNGQLSEEINTITIDETKDDKYTENTEYIYNEKGEKVEENFYINKDNDYLPKYYEENYRFPYKKKFKYDDKGRLLEEFEKTLTIKSNFYYRNRDISPKTTFILTTYKYDEDDHIQSKNVALEIGEEEKYLYTYDEHGNITSERRYKLGQISDNITYTYKYDKQGNWIEKSTYTNGKLDAINKRTISYY